MATARNIITLALESMNRLSPGEALDADLSASCLRRLNSIADDWSNGREMVPQDEIVSAVVSGPSLQLGLGSFALVPSGDEISSMTADTYPMAPITIQQYQTIFDKATQGRPLFYAWDGLSTVFLYPASNGNTIGIVARKAFAVFADLDTVYVMPAGYEGAFAATLAVAMAPSLVGKVSQDLMKAKMTAMFNVQGNNVRPAMLTANPLSTRIGGNILGGFR